jgi:Tol biopolymer transport system component
MMKLFKHIGVALLITTIVYSMGFSQQRDPSLYDYPQNHLPWFTIESNHFMVHFQEGNSRPAQVISRIAEEIYPDVTALYEYEPDTKISIVLNDRLDYSNGAAYFFDNKIEIWLPSLDSPLRGSHDWLRNVITHEFVHIVQIQSSLKFSRKRPVTYIQWLSYEDVRRPDVLYGFPNGIITYPISSVSIPAWLAEGTAQYQRSYINYDHWDSHRDMILRTRILDDSYLRLNVMGTFASKTSIEREVTYNQGFAFSNYLAETYGENVLKDISLAFAERGVYDVKRAIRMATGTDGQIVFDNWIESLESYYHNQFSNQIFTEAQFLEKEGFFNFHPVYSPATNEMLYLSNRKRDDSRVQLYALSDNDLNPVNLLNSEFGQSTGANFTFSCGLSLKPEIKFIASSFSLLPDGQHILYNRVRETRYGEAYNDLYIFNRSDKSNTRLSEGARFTEPSISPDGTQIIALAQRDGSMNIIQINLDSAKTKPIISATDNRVKQLTQFTSGEQIFRPVWHPTKPIIYFAFSNGHGRDIYSLNIETLQIDPILSDDQIDYRDPSISEDGNSLLFSSDLDGIFNIHQMNLETKSIVRLTSVKGGAFMPTLDKEGDLIYSEYVADGYKIARLSSDKWLNDAPKLSYRRPYNNLRESNPKFATMSFNQIADDDLIALPDSLFINRRMPAVDITIPTANASSERTFYPYSDTFTSFSIYPAVRFDNYSKIKGANADLLSNGKFGELGENVWRDVKLGFYFASREMIDRFSLFGGVMIGVGSLPSDGVSGFVQPSRLVELDRDLFLMAEYRGLPFIKRSWSPTVSVELFNIRRNVKDGLSIEEFPCTACLPDTTSIGIAYDVWQAQVSLISKLNRFTALELGWYHSPYRVSTNSFFSREFRQTVSGSTSRYFIGNTLTAALFLKAQTYHRHYDITPIGINASLRYSYQPSRLLEGYDIRGGELIPLYNEYKVHSVELDARHGFKFLDNKLFDFRSRFYTNFNATDEYFFLDYIGGFTGMRSYSFFALGGNTTFFSQLNYHQPIFEKIHKQTGRFTIDKIFTRFFMETGNGWGGPLDVGNNIKSGIGAELRLSMSSYYLFPTRFFISGAYGLNSFDVNLPESFITTTGQNSVTYGKEVLFNFGLLFDFDF